MNPSATRTPSTSSTRSAISPGVSLAGKRSWSQVAQEAGPCGSAGMGAHGVYAGNDAVPGNDGLVRVDTGVGPTCAIPLRSLTIAPGTWDFSIVHEDDFWTDNSGDRGLALYKYTP